jgi:hypothetical protein
MGNPEAEGKAFPVPVFAPFIKAGSKALHAVSFLVQGSHGEEEGSGGVTSEKVVGVGGLRFFWPINQPFTPGSYRLLIPEYAKTNG